MTAQEAYARGFCKTAEAYGVNPEWLVKMAGPMSRQTYQLIRRAMAYGRENFMELPMTKKTLARHFGFKPSKTVLRAARDAAEAEANEVMRGMEGFDLSSALLGLTRLGR